MPDIIRTRIAPTPSGFLHPGNAYNFLLTEAIARKAGGSLRLRIDDLDAPRVRREYVQDLFESLRWLGIEPDSGPRAAEEQTAAYSQQSRITQYNEMLERLVDTGLVFACECSRKDLQQRSNDGHYSGACLRKKIPLDTPDVAWRIQTLPGSVAGFDDAIAGAQQADLWATQRHFIIRRRDCLPAYHVASLCDDLAYDINTIVRGEDLLPSTAAQIYLAGLLGLRSFCEARFYHHPLLTHAGGEKLSKSAGSASLRAMRDAGMSAGHLREAAASWYGSFL